MSLATQSLKLTSIEAARLWRSLQQAKDTDEIDSLLQSLWQVQNNQELATDIMADLADQIDAEIAALKARIEHLITLHQNAINKLESWRSRLDQTVINLNEQGVLNNEIAGQLRRITIKDNPPTCSILVEPEQLPEKYQREQTKIYANKKAITAAWKQGIPVEGTHVYCKRQVVYGFLKSTNFHHQSSVNSQQSTVNSQQL